MRASGARSLPNGVKTSFTYSPTRRFLTRITTTLGATVHRDIQYGRDLAGRIANIVAGSPHNSWTYVYDKTDRLTSADNGAVANLDETFVYQPNGNMVSRTRVPGAYVYPAAAAPRPHAQTAIGATTLTYDANGNLLTDGARTLTWDAGNRLGAHREPLMRRTRERQKNSSVHWIVIFRREQPLSLKFQAIYRNCQDS